MRFLDEIERHPGTHARRAWDNLLAVHGILHTNQFELRGFINYVEGNVDNTGILMTSNVGDPAPRIRLYHELLRLLHNYLAAVVTLVDHTRNLVRGYEGTAMAEEYEHRLEKVRTAGLSRFMAKFRVYLLHYSLPPIGSQVQVTPDGEKITLFLNRDLAMEWPDWPAAAREFLGVQPESKTSTTGCSRSSLRCTPTTSTRSTR